MTVVETAPPAGSVGADATAHDEGSTGFAAMLGTIDHVGLGRLWVLASLLFLLAGGVAGALVGIERLDPGEIDVLDDALPELLSLHATTAIFLFVLPAFLGIATTVVPLQVGATTIAFPRAAAAAFWGWFLSSGVLLASYAVDGGPGGGDRDGILLWAVGLGGVVVSLCLASVCVATTVWALRTAGMTLARVPAFSWSMLVASTVWLLSLPVLLAGIVLVYLEVQYAAPLDAGSLLTWAFKPPQVFAYAIPALGLALEAAPVAAGTPARRHGLALGLVGAFGVLAFGADMLAAGRDPSITQDALYVAAAFALVLPILGVAGAVGDALRLGRPRPTSPLLFGVAALLALLLGAVLGAARVVDGLDLIGTTADPAVGHLALAAGAVGAIGAMHHWSTKLFGTVLGEGVGRLAAVLLLLGGAVLAVPDFVSGLLEADGADAGQLAGLAEQEVADGVEALNLVSLVGGAVVLLGVLLLLVNLVGAAARRADDPVPADPWDGHTLEWRSTSPPSAGGPGPLEPVTSPTPLRDLKEANA